MINKKDIIKHIEVSTKGDEYDYIPHNYFISARCKLICVCGDSKGHNANYEFPYTVCCKDAINSSEVDEEGFKGAVGSQKIAELRNKLIGLVKKTVTEIVDTMEVTVPILTECTTRLMVENAINRSLSYKEDSTDCPTKTNEK